MLSAQVPAWAKAEGANAVIVSAASATKPDGMDEAERRGVWAVLATRADAFLTCRERDRIDLC